ncbi:HD domain-containing protein [Streptococcus pantholopis]|uniref:GTP pyrophosphokinase n=1 Tax=Streptococcus pantholopis TaxID=1811193 RepID=A0A172Q6M8_9STRE|nr:HD domain-containing protein [Streptococcus pantholopis]AND79116.1 GTP pyrophosphokinase [Streptococcus pantholopis]
MTNIVELAHKIAKEAHGGQVDKAGVDYIKHPETVASLVDKDNEKAVAYLHDVIEDTNYSLSDLRSAGLPDEVVAAVDLISKKKGQPYQDYLNNVKTNTLARAVKLADLKHNSDLSRLPYVTSKDRERSKKYKEAIAFLSNQQNEED